MLARLEIDFNCMGVVVPEERTPGVGMLHIFMPATAGHDHPKPDGHGHDADSRVEPHVVRLYHHRNKGGTGLNIAGWALELGRDMADVTLRPATPDPVGADVVNLSTLSGRGVRRDSTGMPTVPLAARLGLGLGGTMTIMAEAWWRLGDSRFRMAHRLVWEIDGLVPEAELHWIPLGTTTGPPPLRTLAEMGAESDGVYRMSIYHVPERTLPPDPFGRGKLSIEEARAHFRALYTLVGLTNPPSELLPRFDDGGGGKVNCGIAQAVFE